MVKNNRYLRKRDDPSRVYPWTELLAERKDMDEVFALNAKDASGLMPSGGAGVKPDFNNMTRAQLFAYADAHYEVKIPPNTNRPDMIAKLNELQAIDNGEYPAPPPPAGDGSVPSPVPPTPIVPQPLAAGLLETKEEKLEREDREFQVLLKQESAGKSGSAVNGNTSSNAD